ncbi:N-acetyl-gamma-glutamyl-phosphate reductase [candidate division NPL-UPA2 bacterium Unc8]|uniref:N-acetyl-gamma-glutamyl-phosphate reductase n=1 Tax=candidate division NPL-UPA2 bacterium Unc8 TaxID=1980939 RepID=A0A399FYG2_UNCN2|nr:N-acetyl-gamma-glutamyl-phosphate reductase [Bacillota bacterium]RII00272.1 MAG: N-acetyl-gamma-glutamyl-phosphate reductase [candidate division NPL-UPA2 bacterium Unc8]
MIKVGIIGATGYGGAELLRLLLSHPEVEVASLAAKMDRAREKIADIFPQLKGKTDLICNNLDMEKMAKVTDFIFLALPHKTSMKIAPWLLEADKRVIDLSADYRLQDGETYKKWYKVKHTSKHLLDEAVYGLPELYRNKIKDAALIANPGCYPTSVILGLAPLLSHNLIEHEEIIVDSKSGVSGAGRFAGDSFNFSEVAENFKAYKIMSHAHQPEMEEQLSKFCQGEVKVVFVPHLLPLKRGILSTIYGKLKKEARSSEVLRIYHKFYQNEPFVNVLDNELPEIRAISGTNYCQIGLHIDRSMKRIVIISALDNLIKGAAGQAIQNMNIMCGFNETEGLGLSTPIP